MDRSTQHVDTWTLLVTKYEFMILMHIKIIRMTMNTTLRYIKNKWKYVITNYRRFASYKRLKYNTFLYTYK